MGNIKLPIELPIVFNSASVSTSVKLPLTLPFTFVGKKGTVKLPVTLPLCFESIGQIKKYTIIKYKEKINFDVIHRTITLPVKETAIGKVTKIPYKEKAWKFPGLILQERVLSHIHKEISLSENVQALILVDFELISSNTLRIKWYGNSVPSFTIMKKSAVDENYTEAGTHNWSEESATFDIGSEDYNIYLQGSSNSGTSSVYNIASINDALVIPDVEVLLNEKIYEFEIDNISKYELVINY